MRTGSKFIVLTVLLAFSMGSTCRQETAQSALDAFFTAIAATTGQAIGNWLTDANRP